MPSSVRHPIAAVLPLELGRVGLYDMKLTIEIGQRHVWKRLDKRDRLPGVGNVGLRRSCSMQHRDGSRHGGVEMLDGVATICSCAMWRNCSCTARTVTPSERRAGMRRMVARWTIGTGLVLVRLLPSRSVWIERGGAVGRRPRASGGMA